MSAKPRIQLGKIYGSPLPRMLCIPLLFGVFIAFSSCSPSEQQKSKDTQKASELTTTKTPPTQANKDRVQAKKTDPAESEPKLLFPDEAPPEPANYRLDHYRDPVPKTLKGATVIDTAAALSLWQAGKTLFIDVMPADVKPANLPKSVIWRTPRRTTIKGATWLANVGYGRLTPQIEVWFKYHLTRLTKADKGAPLLFFCQRNCWMSWNAAKRAGSYGYTNITWFPDGMDGWGTDKTRTERLKAPDNYTLP